LPLFASASTCGEIIELLTPFASSMRNMSEFNSVSSQNYDTSSAFADAVQRARQVSKF